MSGTANSGRRLCLAEDAAGTRAGLELLRWAREQPPGALARVADAAGVSARTISRWMVARDAAEGPTVGQAVAIEVLTEGAVKALWWGKTPNATARR
jgi:hypothetical protein